MIQDPFLVPMTDHHTIAILVRIIHLLLSTIYRYRRTITIIVSFVKMTGIMIENIIGALIDEERAHEGLDFMVKVRTGDLSPIGGGDRGRTDNKS